VIEPGRTAPDFALPGLVDGEGRWIELVERVRSHAAVAVAFVPGDFIPACTAELIAVDEAWGDIPGLAVLCLSGDGLYGHRAYADRYGLEMPVLADFHGDVADSYGLRAAEWEGHREIPRRATVVIDGDWTVQAVETADPLASARPAPAARATAALRECGLDVPRPTVEYGTISSLDEQH